MSFASCSPSPRRALLLVCDDVVDCLADGRQRLRVLVRVVEDLEDSYHQYRRDDALRLIVNLEGETLNRFDRAKLRTIRDRLETL